jgi:hypothetical protein
MSNFRQLDCLASIKYIEPLFTTPNPLLKQEGEFLNGGHQVFPLLFQEGVGGGKKRFEFLERAHLPTLTRPSATLSQRARAHAKG